jgi:hypothetical protein
MGAIEFMALLLDQNFRFDPGRHTVYASGDMQSIYFLDRESENVWRYYSIVRTRCNPP